MQPGRGPWHSFWYNNMQNYRWSAVLIGVLEGLLLVRFIALLFAARPDNPAIMLLLTLTTPLTAPFRALDQLAGQPQFGARLELATLASMIGLLALASCVQWYRVRRPRSTGE